MSEFVTHKLYYNGKRQSVSLEKEIYSALKEISKLEKVTLTELCSLISRVHSEKHDFASAIRIFVCAYYRSLAIAIPKEYLNAEQRKFYVVKK